MTQGAKTVVIFPATEHHRSLASTKLYCLVTEIHVHSYVIVRQPGMKPASF